MFDHIVIITRYLHSTLLQKIVECNQYTAVKDTKNKHTKKQQQIDIISELLKNDVMK